MISLNLTEIAHMKYSTAFFVLHEDFPCHGTKVIKFTAHGILNEKNESESITIILQYLIGVIDRALNIQYEK